MEKREEEIRKGEEATKRRKAEEQNERYRSTFTGVKNLVRIANGQAPVISTTFTSTSKSTSRKTGSAKEIQMGSEDLELQRKKEREWKRNQRKHRSPEAKQATNAKEAERQKEYRLKKKIISIRDGTRHKEREGTESCQSHKLNVKGYWYNKWVSVTRWDDQNQNGTVVVMQSVGGLRGSFSSAARIYS